jgi:iron complex outermembrane receptor protein
MIKWLTRALLGVAAVAITAGRPASAEETSPAPAPVQESGVQLEDVVVTARRMEENLQSVPIAITAITPEALERQDIHVSNQLNMYVPGLTICCQQGAGNSNGGQGSFLYLRGVPGVIPYFGEVPVSIGGSAFYFDLRNVQVLKGPQGTLFGLSGDAGAILFEPQRPTDKFEGSAQVTLGDYARKEFQGVINVPFADGRFLLRAGIDVEHRNGYIHDLTQGRDVADESFVIARLGATFKPSDSFESSLLANYYHDHSLGDPIVLQGVNPSGAALKAFPSLAQYFAQQQALGWYTTPGAFQANGTAFRNTSLLVSDTTRWQLNDAITIKNIAGLFVSRGLFRFDPTSVPLPIYAASPLNTDETGSKSYSEELQLQGKLLADKLTYTVGTFNKWKSPSDPLPVYTVTFGSTAGTLTRINDVTDALYAQGTYDLSDLLTGLSFTGGYRYSWDSVRQSSLAYTASQVAVPSSSSSLSGRFSAPSYTLQLSYQATPGTLLYINNSKGYSSGGFNPATTPAQFLEFHPESLNNVEAGIKSDWSLGGFKARTNLSGFYGRYDNIQVAVNQEIPTATGGTTHATITENAAKGHIQGFEAELTLIPIEQVLVSGNVTYVDDRYDRWISFTNADQPLDLSGTPFILVPSWKYSLHAAYYLPLSQALGSANVAADYAWQGTAHTAQPVPPTPYTLSLYPSVENLNLTLEWQDIAGHRGVDCSVFATNVTNNHWATGKLGAYTTLGVTSTSVAEPRMIGVRLGYRF